MENKYKEIMSHISVDDEMRNRILANINAADLSSNVTPIRPRKSAMNTILRITPFVAAAAVLAIVGVNVLKPTDTSKAKDKTANRHDTDSVVAEETMAGLDENDQSTSIFGITNGESTRGPELDYNFMGEDTDAVDAEEFETPEAEAEEEAISVIAVYETTTDTSTIVLTLYDDGSFVEESDNADENYTGTYVIDGDSITLTSRVDGMFIYEREFAYSDDAITELGGSLNYIRK